MKNAVLQHEFVEYIPKVLEDGTLYVSMIYATAAHKCCCGCGNKVVTPLTPTDWKLIYDGESISITPSIGNWSFPCQSHYWIKRGNIKWSNQWSSKEITAGRSRDQTAKKKHFQGTDTASSFDEKAVILKPPLPVEQSKGFWRTIWEKLTFSSKMY
jgi:hypothetical protein